MQASRRHVVAKPPPDPCRCFAASTMVGGSAAFVVLGVDVGRSCSMRSSDDLLAVLRVLAGIVQGSASDIVSDIHALGILTQQRAHSVESSRAATASRIGANRSRYSTMSRWSQFAAGQRRGSVVRVAGVHVCAEFDEQFDGAQLTGESGVVQRRWTVRPAVDVKAQFHEQAKTVRAPFFGGQDEEFSRIVQQRRIAVTSSWAQVIRIGLGCRLRQIHPPYWRAIRLAPCATR